METIKDKVNKASEHICRAIESCVTDEQLETAYRWGCDVILSMIDQFCREKGSVDAMQYLKSHKHYLLGRIKQSYMKVEDALDKNTGTMTIGREQVIIRDVEPHNSLCRKCGGTGRDTTRDDDRCYFCSGSGRVVTSSTIRTYIRPYQPGETKQ